MLPHTTEGIDPDVARENPWKRSVRLSVHLIFKDLRHRVGEGKGLFIDETRSRGRVLNVRGKRENFAETFPYFERYFPKNKAILLHCFK